MDADADSNTTSADDNTGNLCDNPIRDTLAEGILGLLKPTVDELDDKVRATRISQVELKQQIDSLSDELKKLNQSLQNHPIIDVYVKKLITCKHKITVVLNVLQTAQERLNEIRRMVTLEAGLRHKLLRSAESEEPQPGPSITITSTQPEET